MGGGQALQIGLAHLDTFSYIVRLLWFGAGKAEQRMHTAAAEADQALSKAGVENVFFECPFAHEWQT